MSMDGVTTFRNIFHSENVEHNCTSQSADVHRTGTEQYPFLLISCCTPPLEVTKVPKMHL